MAQPPAVANREAVSGLIIHKAARMEKARATRISSVKGNRRLHHLVPTLIPGDRERLSYRGGGQRARWWV